MLQAQESVVNPHDPRYIALRRGLEQLSSEQLRRILDYDKPTCFDRYNYDESTGRY